MAARKRKTKRAHKNRQSSAIVVYQFIVYVFLIAVLGTFFFKLFSPLVANTADVLGINFLAKGGDGDSSGSGSGDSGSGESRDSDDDSASSGSSGTHVSTPSKVETRTTTNVSSDDDDDDDDDDEDDKRTIVETQSDETKTEIRLNEEERIKVRTKDGRTRIDITSGGVKTRLEFRDDRVVIKAEQEDGAEVELEDDTIFKIDDRLDASGIKIATAGAEKFIVQRGGTGAVTEFPLSIDLATNTLLVNTPAGQRQVTVLPDQAVQNLIAANVISQLVSNNSLVASDITSVGSVIALGEKNGVPIYQILGISNQRLLGFIPVVIEKTVTVSAETGEIESTLIPIFDRILDIVSF